MKSSLTFKLIAAFAAVCIIEAVVVSFLVREVTQRNFDNFLYEEAIEVFEQDVRRYYNRTGTLDGIQMASRGDRVPRNTPPPRGGPNARPPGGRGEEGRRPQNADNPRFGLATPDGNVLISNGAVQIGQLASAKDMGEGIPFVVEGEVVGVMILPGGKITLSRRELDFLRTLDLSLLAVSLGVVLLGIGLGGWLARGYTKPIKDLTIASKALADGELGRQVDVTSSDEVGELSASFNKMSVQLQEVSSQRRQMIADIAHDLRTPLTVLAGYLEALRNEELKATPERFETLHKEALHLSRLVDDLRILALADAGELSLELESTNVEQLLEQIRDSFQNKAEKAGVLLLVDCEEGVGELQVDAGRMRQVLTNLVGNAMRYTASGGSVNLRARDRHGHVQIAVEDTGVGIASEALPYLFDRFYRADNSRQRTEGETGLGLAISKSLVEAHGGVISVESEEGTGSTFTVQLPRS